MIRSRLRKPPPKSTRNAVYDWFKGSLMTRFDKPAEGAMVVVQQRLHQDDLIGRLRDEGGWDYLEMPGECVERQVFDLGDGESWAFNPGDLLFEERFNRAALEQLFWDLGEGQYNAQILQRPSPPGGALFKLKHFQRYETPPQATKRSSRAGTRRSSTPKPRPSPSARPGASSAGSSI